MAYLQQIWSTRYFWLHLTRAELKYKFRRSKLGLLWTMINPLVLSLLMAFVFSNLLKVDIQDFIPYIFSGNLVWSFLLDSVMGGCNSLIVSEVYIKQFKHPMAIYPLRTTLVNATTFSIAFLGLVGWIIILHPANLLVALLVMPISLISFIILGWPICILASFINTKYRDFLQIAMLFMQGLWYISPVFFKPQMFESANLANLLEYNPVTHVLNLVRAPMLYGQLPTWADFGMVYGAAAILYILAYLRIRSEENRLVFYF